MGIKFLHVEFRGISSCIRMLDSLKFYKHVLMLSGI